MNMKNLKILFCLFFLLSIGSSNVWGEVNVGDEYSWNNSTKTLTIHKAGDYADGIMVDYSSSSTAPWKSTYEGLATKIVIESGITHVGAYSFYKFTKVTDVTIPSTVTSFGSEAFNNCSYVEKLYYEGSPSEWADINFTDLHAHPCGARTTSVDYYFYGSETRTDLLIFSPTITEIKKYAFYRCNLHSEASYNGACFPGTISKIGEKAFYGATFNGEVAFNRVTAPTLGTDVFALTNSDNSINLYVPTGASGYTTSGWNKFKTPEEKTTSSTSRSDFNWELSNDGTLTIEAKNGTKSIALGAASDYPWYRFRRLIYKIVLKGEITNLNNSCTYLYGLSEISLNQNTIPSVGTIASNSTSGSSYNQLNNKRDQLKLRVKPETLLNVTEVAKLTSSPWNDTKSGTTKWWQVGLSETATLYDNGLNLDTLEAIKEHVDLPINLQLNRTLSNEYYNTFCSPVNMTEAEVTAMFDAETELVEFDGTEIINDTLRLKFKEATSITAGKPYLIWPESPVSNPTFTDVNPASIATSGSIVSGTYADFYGTLAPVEVSPGQIGGKNFIFLLANNKLTYATDGTLKGMRAYFLLEEGTPASVMAKRPVLQIGNGENTTTDLGQVPSDKIQCTKVLRDGQIYILRGEKAYNLQGIEIETTRY